MADEAVLNIVHEKKKNPKRSPFVFLKNFWRRCCIEWGLGIWYRTVPYSLTLINVAIVKPREDSWYLLYQSRRYGALNTDYVRYSTLLLTVSGPVLRSASQLA